MIRASEDPSYDPPAGGIRPLYSFEMLEALCASTETREIVFMAAAGMGPLANAEPQTGRRSCLITLRPALPLRNGPSRKHALRCGKQASAKWISGLYRIGARTCLLKNTQS